jgi:peptidoglycan/LPS O-acetylase OafA/YrhL
MPAWSKGMRAVHIVLCVILLLFAALQYNDPDWYYWGLVYLLAAGWSALAALAPQRLQSWPPARIGAPVSVLLFLVGFASLAHELGPGWIHNEEAREALGYLICAITTALSVWDTRRRASSAPQRGAS